MSMRRLEAFPHTHTHICGKRVRYHDGLDDGSPHHTRRHLPQKKIHKTCRLLSPAVLPSYLTKKSPFAISNENSFLKTRSQPFLGCLSLELLPAEQRAMCGRGQRQRSSVHRKHCIVVCRPKSAYARMGHRQQRGAAMSARGRWRRGFRLSTPLNRPPDIRMRTRLTPPPRCHLYSKNVYTEGAPNTNRSMDAREMACVILIVIQDFNTGF